MIIAPIKQAIIRITLNPKFTFPKKQLLKNDNMSLDKMTHHYKEEFTPKSIVFHNSIGKFVLPFYQIYDFQFHKCSTCEKFINYKFVYQFIVGFNGDQTIITNHLKADI